VDRVTGRLVVAIAGGDGTQLAHASGLFLHASEVRVVTLVILHGRTGQVQRLGHAQHALFEDVVKAGGGVGRLDAGQQTACLRAQAHDIPNVGVERLGVREGDAPRIRGLQLRGRERRLAEHVHAARVDRLVPCQVQPSDVAAPVAGHQIEELAAGQYLTGGEVAVGVDDRAPYGPGRAGLVPAAQVHRFVDAVGASHADHAAQVGVVASFRTPRIRRLVEGRAGRVEQRYLRVDQRRLAGFARAGEQRHRQLRVRGGTELMVALIGSPVDEPPAFHHPSVGDHLHVLAAHRHSPSRAVPPSEAVSSSMSLSFAPSASSAPLMFPAASASASSSNSGASNSSASGPASSESPSSSAPA